jgi:hypothetical protein
MPAVAIVPFLFCDVNELKAFLQKANEFFPE